jgi:hypothetical protein
MFLFQFLRFLGYLLLVRVVLRALFPRRPTPRPARPEPPPTPRGGDLVLDPVCNTHVLKERALRASIGGRQCYFCSPACRDQALTLDRAS